ncbi:LacI family DNA-binding transcriptional regulator [Paractinoplanes maris]|uniref:LacI family DNA-binding transcriptional regulator n=1 Tax=Paractinoplanes maris TaxID=1734446 RepID=UPI0020210624|nr:LacI family DNA-binding transcriptional regulator [Actinoplanes maris]
MSDHRVTMEEIARAAGVSVPTVSRVLNGKTNVSPRKRELIQDLLRQHSYRPRTTRKRPSAGLIHVVFCEIDCAWELEHLRGMEPVARDAGVGLVVTAAARIVPGPTDGVVLAATSGSRRLTDELDRLGVPVVALDPAARELTTPTVGAANWSGARAATTHLIELGHRRIAMINGSAELMASCLRRDGFRSLAGDSAPIADGEFTYAFGLSAGLELLGRADRPTGVFAASDNLAMGVYEAARRLGLRIPDDVSVVGFDDVPAARWASPPLTTVRQPLRDMGRLAAHTVLRLARGDELESESMELRTRLIVRASTTGIS